MHSPFRFRVFLLAMTAMSLGAIARAATDGHDLNQFFKNSRSDQKKVESAYQQAMAQLDFKPEQRSKHHRIILGNSLWMENPDQATASASAKSKATK